MKKVNDRLLRWFFGIPGVIDEQVKSEIGKVSTRTVVILFIFEMLYIGLTYLFASNGMISDFESYFYLTLFIQFIGIILIILGFSMLDFNRKNSVSPEVTNQKEKEKVISLLKRKYIRSTPILFFLFISLNTIFDFSNSNPFKEMLTIQRAVMSLLWSITFCLMMYFYEKGQIKIIED